MIISVTVLGNKDGMSPATVGQKVVEYLEGGRTVAAGQRPGTLAELPSPEGGTVAYYADSAGLRPGRWAPGKSGEVDPAELAVLLAGYDPATSQPLISAKGSAGRAARERERPLSAADLSQDSYSVREVASMLGVSKQRVFRTLDRLTGAGDAEGIAHEGGAWRIERDVVAKLLADRKPPRVVAGYDVTFSPPKSVSVLWAGGDDATKAAVLDALDESVAAGLRYMNSHALSVRVRGAGEQATGVLAADYLHTTSRALEPQLHHHVVIANVGTGPDGIARALDARMLFHHAKTASFIAGAELRHQLTARLGVEWTEVENGIAEIAGVPQAAMSEMSSRSKEIASATAELDYASAKARQVAAWETRAAKVHGVDLDALYRNWDERLTAAEYGEETRANVLGRVDAPSLFTTEVRERTLAQLVRSDGITANEAVFDRRLVVQRLSEIAGDRLSGDAIDAMADEFLARPEVVGLAASGERSSRGIIRRGDGRIVTLAAREIYTTTSMLALERRALASYEGGRDAAVGIVPAEALERVLAEEGFARLSDEQRVFVAELTGSGMRIQAAVGAAGTGKTTTLEAAVTAWEEAGFTVIGAAVGGTQAVVLGEETGIDGRTVASLLARYFDHGDMGCVDDRTVLLVDEASLLSTRDFAALARIAEESGAALRLVGDPAQHSAVAAGGIYRYVVEHHASEVPTLTHLHRQQGPQMEEVRLANVEYREGKITEAINRLQRDGRITEANSADEAYDLLVAGWYAERQERSGEPDRRRSAMTAEHHFERRELNDRARALLASDGTLSGPSLTIGELSFRAGDEVIARIADRSLRADVAPRNAYVRNGSIGTVAEIREASLAVDFDRWGRVDVPVSYLDRQISPGVVGGLQHAYTVTTHAAQGETFAVAAPLVTDTSSPEGVYVGITRGQFDLRGVAVRRRDLVAPSTDDKLPVLRDEIAALEAMTARLLSSDRERLASDLMSSGVHEQNRPAGHRDRSEAEVRFAPESLQARSDEQLLEAEANLARELRSVVSDERRLASDVERRAASIERLHSSGKTSEVLEEGNRIASGRITTLGERAAELREELLEIEQERERRGIEAPSFDAAQRQPDRWSEEDRQPELMGGPVARPSGPAIGP